MSQIVFYESNRASELTSFSASTTTTKKITTPVPTTPPMSAETCEGTVDFKMRNGKAKIVRSGEISKTVRLTQSKESFEIQFLVIFYLILISEFFKIFNFKPKL